MALKQQEMSEQPAPPAARKILDEYRQSPPNDVQTFLNHQLDLLPAAERCPTADALLALLNAEKSNLEELRASTLKYRKCWLHHIKRLDYLTTHWSDGEWVPERYKPAEFGMNLVEKMAKITKHTQQMGGELSELWGPESVPDALCKDSGILTNKIAGLAAETIVKRPLQNVQINRRRRPASLHDAIIAAAASASTVSGPIIAQDLPVPPKNTGPNSPNSRASRASAESPDIRASSPPSPEIGRAADHAARDDFSSAVDEEEGLDIPEDAESDTDFSVALETASWQDDDAEVFLNGVEGDEQQLHELLSSPHMHIPPHDYFDDRTFHLTRVSTGHDSKSGWPLAQAQAQAEELETGQPKASNTDMAQPKDQKPPSSSMSMDLRPLLAGAMLKDDVLHACLQLNSPPPDIKILDPLYFQKDSATQPQPLRTPSRYRKLLLPLHHTNPQYRTLAVIDTKDQHFDHYDSCRNEPRYNEVKTALRGWIARMFSSTDDMPKISGKNIPCPQQEDSTSCGLFVVAFAQALLLGTSLPDVVDVNKIRNECYTQLSNQAQRQGASSSESPPPTQVDGEELRTSYRNSLPTPAASVNGSDTEVSSSAKKRSCEDQDHEGDSNFPALLGLAASISESQKQCNIKFETTVKEHQRVANDLGNITILTREMTSQMNLRLASLEMLTVRHATIAGQHDQKRRKIESRQRWFSQSITQRPVDITLEDVEDLQKAQDVALQAQREELGTIEQQLAEAYHLKTFAEREFSAAQSTQKSVEQQEIQVQMLANKMDQKAKNLERIKGLLEKAYELSLEVQL